MGVYNLMLGNQLVSIKVVDNVVKTICTKDFEFDNMEIALEEFTIDELEVIICK